MSEDGKAAVMKAHWHNIANMIAALLLLALSAAASLFFGLVSLFYVLLMIGFGLFLWVEDKRKHPLSEPKQAIYERMLDKE